MTQDQVVPVFEWFANQFTVAERADFLEAYGPVLASLFRPGEQVLDLGCGAGAIAFYLAEQGARVTGIDLAPALIAMAREEAARRGAPTTFRVGNVLADPLGDEEYECVICLGNVILDFPHEDFPRFRDRVHQALKPGGHLALGYRDGVMRVLDMREPEEVIEDGAEGQIQRRFKAYDPARGAFVMEYRHLVTGQVHEPTGYVYTGPLIRLLLEGRFDLVRSIRTGESRFLDVYVRR